MWVEICKNKDPIQVGGNKEERRIILHKKNLFQMQEPIHISATALTVGKSFKVKRPVTNFMRLCPVLSRLRPNPHESGCFNLKAFRFYETAH